MADSCTGITYRMQVMQVALQASADGPACSASATGGPSLPLASSIGIPYLPPPLWPQRPPLPWPHTPSSCRGAGRHPRWHGGRAASDHLPLGGQWSSVAAAAVGAGRRPRRRGGTGPAMALSLMASLAQHYRKAIGLGLGWHCGLDGPTQAGTKKASGHIGSDDPSGHL
jgi:hypothetical protein